MVEPLEYKAIIEKLLEKTRAGRVPWEVYGAGFRCDISEHALGLDKYIFHVCKTEDGYAVRMEDFHQRTIFSVVAQEEILYRDPAKEEIFHILSDLYELARRKALNIPDKLTSVAELLDRI